MESWPDSPYTGFFTRLAAMEPEAHDPAVTVWSGALACWGSRAEELPVGGCGWDERQARAACLGEGLERLQPCPLPDDGSVEASFESWPLDEPAVEPGRWVLFHPEQYGQRGFPFVPLTRATRCRWLRFRQAVSGAASWVPEELAYLFLPSGRGHLLCPSISTGLSCGRWGDPVLLRGLQEVVERDAVVGAWWGRYGLEEWPAEMVFAGLPPGSSARLLRRHLRYRFYRADSPWSSHVTIVTVEGEERGGFCLGAGSACRETREASWSKSLLEAVHAYRYARRLRELRAPERVERLEQFADHALYYSLHPGRLGETPLRNAGGPTPRQAGEEGLAHLQERLGPERPVLFRSMTPPAVARELGDWYVLRVVVPGLQPLHGDRRFAHLGGDLWAPRGLAEWGRIPPHPFA